MAKALFIIIILALGLALGIFLVSRNNSVQDINLQQKLSNDHLSAQSASQSALEKAAAQPTATTDQGAPTPIPTQDWISATSAAILTAKGTIQIELYPQDAPKTVTNFATLAKSGYYNGLTFHRVVPGFVVQGGDPKGDGTGGYSIYGPTFGDELNATTSSYKAGYMEGVVAMANRGPNTNGSQFFIMLADNTSLPHDYTIFGKVTSGMDVVKQIQIGDKMLTVTVE